MLSQIGDIYAFILGWPALRRINYSIFYLSARALGMLNHVSVRLSGENYAIAYALNGKEMPVVFDVGANEGHWIDEVLRYSPQAIIHAFEPQKKLAEIIALKYPNIQINNVGVGEAKGYLDLYDYADHSGSQHASLLKGVIDGIHKGSARSQRVMIESLDEYCEKQNIHHIDFLKIDVEGYEMNVLKGANKILQSKKVEVIQFEFNEMNVVAGKFLNDFYQLFQDNYRLYRLLPHGMTKLDQGAHWFNEQFVYQNIIAIKITGN